MKIYAGQLNFCVGDIEGNAEKIIAHINLAREAGADIAVFPELAITGYPPEDLLLEQSFIEKEQQALAQIIAQTKNFHVILGATFSDENGLHNAAYYLHDGQAKVISGKTNLPNYGVFDERRYFVCSDIAETVAVEGKKIAVLVCEDTWTPEKTNKFSNNKIDYLISINASPYESKKLERRYQIASARALQASAEIIYINTIGGQDGIVFDGGSFIINGASELKANLPQFVEAGEIFHEQSPLVNSFEANYKAIGLGLKDYVTKNGFKKVLLGLSGGMDSALVATIAVDALGAENVRLVVLPTHFTSKESYQDAEKIAANLGVIPQLIDIEPAFKAFTEMLEESFKGTQPGLTEENIQSRIRGVTLMALSNKFGELLLTTGNKSEVAVGYTTLYGDSCGAFNPIIDLYKTEVYEIAKWRNSQGEVIPQSIFTKAPTAELRYNQTDQDSLPPYEILDEILKLLIEGRKSVDEIVKNGFQKSLVESITMLLKRAEYKRFQSAPGVKLSTVAFGKDWRYPLTNKFD